MDGTVAIVGALGLLIGTLIATIAQFVIACMQNTTAHRGITTKAFNDAIYQLGSTEQAVVIGGIYALHKIAKSEQEAYAQTVANVLCGYVKAKTGRKEYKEGCRVKKLRATMENPSEEDCTADLAVQAIIDLLFRDTEERNVYNKCRKKAEHARNKLNQQREKKDISVCWVDLSDSFLCGIRLYDADLTYVDFWNANLCGVNLYHSDLSGAYLGRTDMRAAKLCGTKLNKKTFLKHTKFQGAFSEKLSYPDSRIRNALAGESKPLETDFSEVEIKEGLATTGVSKEERHAERCKWVIERMKDNDTPDEDAKRFQSLQHFGRKQSAFAGIPS